MPKNTHNSSSQHAKTQEARTTEPPRSQPNRASKSTAYEKHLWTLDKPAAGRKRGQSNASIHQADVPAGKKPKHALRMQQDLNVDADDEGIEQEPPTPEKRPRRRFRPPQLNVKPEDDEEKAATGEHADAGVSKDAPATTSREPTRQSKSANKAAGVPRKSDKEITAKKGNISVDHTAGDEDDEDDDSGSNAARSEEQDSGSEQSADVEWGGLSQKAMMAETPMWVDDEAEELSVAAVEKRGKVTHRRHTSTTSVSSAATNPPSSADGDSGADAAGHQSDDAGSDAESMDLNDRPSTKSAAMYGYRPSSQKPQKQSRAEKAREAETPQWEQETRPSAEDHAHKTRHRSKHGRKDDRHKRSTKAVKDEEVEGKIDDDTKRPSASVNNDIELVYPDKQWNELPIGVQQTRVRKVAHISIFKVSRAILFDNAFPDEGTAQSLYATTALVQTASELGYADIKARLRADEQYAHDLATIPSQRISTLRGPVKKAAFPTVAPVYGLQPGPACKNDVDWLLESLRYIYPWHSTKGDTPVQKRRLISTMPFQNEAIIEVVSASFFSGSPSLADKYKMEFSSSIEEAVDELELPAAMLALASTAVGSSIMDWRSGSRPKKPKGFSADANQDLYNSNMKVLLHMQTKDIKKYHVLMHDLYLKFSDGISAHTSAHDADGAIALLDLDGMSG